MQIVDSYELREFLGDGVEMWSSTTLTKIFCSEECRHSYLHEAFG